MGCGSSKIAASTIKVQPAIATDKTDVTNNEALMQVTSLDTLESLGSSNKLMTSATSQDNFRRRRKNLIASSDVFEDVDKRSSHVPSAIRTDAEQLVKHLIEPYDSPLFKLRAIWIWVTHNISYNVNSYFNPQDKKSSQLDASNVLTSGRAICSGYSNVFKVLTEIAGIQTERVNGWSKGYSYVAGMKFAGSDPNHAWNAVYLHDNWWLLDATWGAGHVDENQNFVCQHSEHYFLTDPKQFIYDHYPCDNDWQLLEKMIPIETFEQYVKLTKHFFRLNMKPFSHHDGLIACDTGKLHLKFRIDKDIPLKCTGKLADEQNPTEGGDRYIHIYSTEKTLHVLVDVPHQGDFKLKLFARHLNNESILPLVCTYNIQCMGKLGKASTFPRQFKRWSPGFYLHSPTDGVLYTGETYKFRITLPRVSDMAVCLGGKNSTWERILNTNGALWEGEITLPDGTERVNVVAKFDHQKDNSPFSSVLEYKVVERDWN